MRTFAGFHPVHGLGGDVPHLLDGVTRAAGVDAVVVAPQFCRWRLLVVVRRWKGRTYTIHRHAHMAK